MRIRRPVALLATLLILAASPILAESPPSVIAVVLSRDAPPYREARDGFESVLQRSGRSFEIREFVAGGLTARRGTLIEKIRSSRPELVFVVGSVAMQAVIAEVDDLPVVFSMVLSTNGQRSLEEMRVEHPNLAGISMEIPVATQLAELKRLLPAARRIGVLFDPEVSGATLDAAGPSARALGMELISFPVSNDSDLVASTKALSSQVDALWSAPDSTIFSARGRRHILLQTLRQRIPFFAPSPSFVRDGALAALSTDYSDLGRQAAQQALEILGGRHAYDLPLTPPRRLELSINMNTARRIQVEFDQGALPRTDVGF